MADNTTLDAGSGGDTIATDDIAGVKYQRVKVTAGADGTATDIIAGGGVEASALLVTVASDSTGVLSVDDNGGSLTVDNAALSVVGGGVEATAQRVTLASDSTGVLSVDDNGASLTVDNASLSVTGGGVELGAMRVTIANDSTGVVSVDDNGGSLTVDGTVAVSGTVAVDSELTTADLDTGAGTDTRAVVGIALAGSGGAVLAGTANPVPISDNAGSLTVDGTVAATQSGTWTVQPGNTANTTAWKVDASSVAVPITDNSGSLTVDNGGTFAVQDSQVVADNAGFTDGTTKVQPAGFIFDEVAGTALTENDAAAARIDSKRAIVGTIEDATTRGQRAAVSAGGALKVDASATTQPVSGTVAATQSGTWTVQPGNTANTTAWKVDGSAVTQPVSYATTGSGNATGALRVELANNGTGVMGTVGTVTTVSTLTGGGVAHDAADSGNPVKVGGKAGTADVTAVADGDRTDMRMDTLGHQVVRPYALHENLVSGATAAITDTTSTSVLAAAGAGVRNYITSVLVTNSHATVGTLVTIKDNAGSTLYAGYAAPAGGGFSISFPTPLRGAANTATHAVCGTTGANVYVSASGYKSAV